MSTKEEMFQELVAAFPTLEFDPPFLVGEPNKFSTLGRATDGSGGGLYFTYTMSTSERPWYEVDLDYMGVVGGSSAALLRRSLVEEMQLHVTDASITLKWLGVNA